MLMKGEQGSTLQSQENKKLSLGLEQIVACRLLRRVNWTISLPWNIYFLWMKYFIGHEIRNLVRNKARGAKPKIELTGMNYSHGRISDTSKKRKKFHLGVNFSEAVLLFICTLSARYDKAISFPALKMRLKQEHYFHQWNPLTEWMGKQRGGRGRQQTPAKCKWNEIRCYCGEALSRERERTDPPKKR